MKAILLIGNLRRYVHQGKEEESNCLIPNKNHKWRAENSQNIFFHLLHRPVPYQQKGIDSPCTSPQNDENNLKKIFDALDVDESIDGVLPCQGFNLQQLTLST